MIKIYEFVNFVFKLSLILLYLDKLSFSQNFLINRLIDLVNLNSLC